MNSNRTALASLLGTSLAIAFAAACSDSDDGGGNGGVTIVNACTAPPSCGGDPVGEWLLVGGCVEPPPEGFECADAVSKGRGTATGTFTIEAGGFSSDTDVTLRQCGWVDDSSSGNGSSLTIEGNQMVLGSGETLTFCVEGDTLWLHDLAAEYPDLRVLRLQRDSESVE